MGQSYENTQKLYQNILTGTAVFINQKRANVCEHTTKMASLEFLKGATRGLREEWMEGNLKGDYLRLMPEFSLSFPLFCIIRTSVLSFPRGLFHVTTRFSFLLCPLFVCSFLSMDLKEYLYSSKKV